MSTTVVMKSTVVNEEYYPDPTPTQPPGSSLPPLQVAIHGEQIGDHLKPTEDPLRFATSSQVAIICKRLLKSLKIYPKVADSSGTVWVWAIKGVGFNSPPLKFNNDCNVISSCCSLRTALCESIRYRRTKSPTRPDTQGAPRGGCSHAPRDVTSVFSQNI